MQLPRGRLLGVRGKPGLEQGVVLLGHDPLQLGDQIAAQLALDDGEGLGRKVAELVRDRECPRHDILRGGELVEHAELERSCGVDEARRRA